VDISLQGGDVTVKGPKGVLSRPVPPNVELKVTDGTIHVIPASDDRKIVAMQGLTRSLVANMVTGVDRGFQRVLEIVGVGYRVDLKGDVLTFNVGYSQPVTYKLPKGITAVVEKTRLTLAGIDKELLGATAATIRGFRKPEPYKGKGIKYAEERIRRKVGKAGAK
jgi:large subunit ribosomal protein L6